MRRTTVSVEEFLAGIEGGHGEDMRRLDEAIREHMPGAERHLYEGKFWGGSDQQIVGYGMMDYQNRSGEDVEWFTVGLAEQKNYLSMYFNAVENERYLLDQYKDKLGKVKTGSASISFDSVTDVDFENLMDLVRRAGELA